MSNTFKLSLLFVTVPLNALALIIGLFGIGMSGSSELLALVWATLVGILILIPVLFFFKKHLLQTSWYWPAVAILYLAVILLLGLA